MIAIINKIIESIAFVVSVVLQVLPETPFQFTLGELGQFWSAANYFVPFNAMAIVMSSYVSAVAVWYVSRWVLRIAKYIG